MRDCRSVLLVEDDNVDALTIERAFKDLKITNKLIHVANSEKAIEYLQSNSNKKPCIILLDLNMPKISGIEFLREIKRDKKLSQIPVIILTASSLEKDIHESFFEGAVGYIVKSAQYPDLLKKIEAFHEYWTFSELPTIR